MLRITGVIPQTGFPSFGPQVTISLDVTGAPSPIYLQVEDVNGATRAHYQSTSDLRVFHMMCLNGSIDDRRLVLGEIAVDPETFYDALKAVNDSQLNPQLHLFTNHAGVADMWVRVQNALAANEIAVDAAAALEPASTPCYAMIISCYTPNRILLDVQISAVAHT